MSKKLKPLPDGGVRKWKVYLDGEIFYPGIAEFTSELGTVTLGVGPENYHRLLYKQPGGGGSVVIPHFTINGVPHIGILRMDRSDTLNESLSAAGSYLHKNENHFAAGNRIVTDEFGLKADNNPIKLIGIINTDRSYVSTPENEDGIHFYELSISPDDVMPTDNGTYILKAGIAGPLNAGQHKISAFEFFPWYKIVTQKDGFIAIGIGLLLGYLYKKGAFTTA